MVSPGGPRPSAIAEVGRAKPAPTASSAIAESLIRCLLFDGHPQPSPSILRRAYDFLNKPGPAHRGKAVERVEPGGRPGVIRMNYDLRMAAHDHAPPAAGPYLQTVSGRWVNPFDPDPQQLDAGDIARALANQCRFGGHSRVFYSVAQHSVIVSRLVEERGGDVEDVFAALMHDATEAYLGDMPHPLKHRSPLGAEFKAAEDHLEQAIRARFRIKPDVPEIKRADRALLATERRAFSAETWHWPELEGVEPLALELTAWSPDEAARAFAERYAELEARR